MEWSDEGMLLSVRKHGEGSAIIDIFTQANGRQTGVMRGGGSRKSAALLQPGAQLSVTWRARLSEHIGTFSVEPKFSRTASILTGKNEIAAFGALTSLISLCLPERENQNIIYQKTMLLLQDFRVDLGWLAAYVRWELAMLAETGFGLDLGSCAATGANDDLCYVSPKSGRAVSAAGAIGWEDKLLKLPEFLCQSSAALPSFGDINAGLKLTGYFLNSRLMAAVDRKELPQARDRFLQTLKTF